MTQTIAPELANRRRRATQIDTSHDGGKTYSRRAGVYLLAGLFMLGLASLASGQEPQSKIPLRGNVPPKSLLPFANLFPTRSTGKTTPTTRSLFPTSKTKLAAKPAKKAANSGATEEVPQARQVLNEEGLPVYPYITSPRPTARAQHVEDVPSRKIHVRRAAAPGEPVEEADDVIPQPEVAGKAAVLRISDDEDPEFPADEPPAEHEFDGTRSVLGKPVMTPEEEPVPEVLPSASSALASQVQFKPHKISAAPASLPVQPALVKRVQPNELQESPTSTDLLQPPTDPAPVPEPEEIMAEFKSIGSLGVRTRAEGDKFPSDVAVMKFKNAGEVYQSLGYRREWATSAYFWEAPGLCHSPLYFQEINLERHGYSFGPIQPGISGLQFYGRLMLLPYLMAINPPNECVYTLGYYRPGSYAPFQLHRPPVRARGLTAEAAVIATLFLVLP